MAEDLWRWDAVTLAQAIAARDISAREAVASCLQRMRAVNPAINAVTVDLSAGALEAADRVDRAVARGEPVGPLAGVPVTVKQNTDQAGCATTSGVVAFAGVIAEADSPVVAQWKAAGAAIIGRTNTPAFNLRWDSVNDLHGQTRNPFSRGRTPGGSSGGAAAALAAGIGPLAHGTDLGGSIRYPAYACGVAGLRPTPGRVALFNGTAPAEWPPAIQLMAVQGPMARRVRDVRLGFAAMLAPDPRDPWWIPAPQEGPLPPPPIRVAVVEDPAHFGAAAAHPDVRAAVRRAAVALTAAGYAVEAIPTPGFARAAELWISLMRVEIRRLLLPLIESLGDDGVRTATRLFLGGGPEPTMEDYLRALAERTRLARQWSLFLERCPLVLAPASLEPPFPLGFDTESQSRMDAVLDAQRPQLAVPLLGLPAVAVPTGLAGGLPTGVQIIGPRLREDLCLAAAEAVEAGMPRLGPWDPAA